MRLVFHELLSRARRSYRQSSIRLVKLCSGDNKNVNFPTRFCLKSISNGFIVTKSRELSLNGHVYGFSVDFMCW